MSCHLPTVTFSTMFSKIPIRNTCLQYLPTEGVSSPTEATSCQTSYGRKWESLAMATTGVCTLLYPCLSVGMMLRQCMIDVLYTKIIWMGNQLRQVHNLQSENMSNVVEVILLVILCASIHCRGCVLVLVLVKWSIYM